MRSRQRPTAAATQSDDDNDNNSRFDDMGIVYRDHKIIDDDDVPDVPITQPLSIEDDDDDGNKDLLHQNSSDEFHSLHRHPAYTPQMFKTHPHLAVLPVLLLEFLALALTRAVLPSLLLKRYGSRTYIIMGGAECIRGIFAFFACPLFGKLSDVYGRRPCLLITVVGTLAPVCSLAFWKPDSGYDDKSSIGMTAELSDNLTTLETDHILDGIDAGDASSEGGSWFPTLFFGMDSQQQFSINILPSLHRIDVFVMLFALSGVFASTFTLTFAYISDVVKDRDGRVSAYGLALATFGLSFTVGPLLGGYFANVNDDGKGQGGRSFLKLVNTDDDNESSSPEQHEQSSGDIHPIGQHRVFVMTLVLAVLDLSIGMTAELSDNLTTLETDHILDGIDAGDASSEGGSWFPTLFFGMDSQQQFSINILPSLHRIDVFVMLFALSGVFASTFTLTFAYISDVVKDRDGRVSAYGLALATFGLSFTVGPLLGGYFANVNDDGKGQGGRSFLKLVNTDDDNESSSPEQHEQSSGDIHPIGQHRVFVMTLVLAVLDLCYIHFILPESLNHSKRNEYENSVSASRSSEIGGVSTTAMAETSSTSNVALPGGVGVSRRASSSWWNPMDSIHYLTTDPLLSSIGRITILYYTALHAVVSTLILYAARQFQLGPHRLGELMAALGLSTMLSEAVLVRIAIPALGEPRSMRVGLISFTLQCILLAVAGSPWHLFMCAVLAIPGNLVYPSITSLVSTSVKPEMVGRALGSINGVKSLTEGLGPLLFGTLLTISEHDALPGWPYFIAAIMSALAWHATKALPEDTTERTGYYPARDDVDYEEMEPFNEKDNA